MGMMLVRITAAELWWYDLQLNTLAHLMLLANNVPKWRMEWLLLGRGVVLNNILLPSHPATPRPRRATPSQ